MLTEQTLLFIYTETPLHAGTGRGLGAVDLPIQREKVTGYPLVQGSSLKGRLRAAVREAKSWKDDSAELAELFGRAGGEGDNWAGAIAPGDAKLLLFPVRSLAGIFAWITSVDALARFVRDTAIAGMLLEWDLNTAPGENQCWIATQSAVAPGNQVTLEEFSYTASKNNLVDAVATWLSRNALPTTAEYQYWRNNLAAHLVILPREDFRDFTISGTEVVTRVKLIPDLKTVQEGALWTEEALPADTLLYAPVAYGASRKQNEDKTSVKNATEVWQIVGALNERRMQLGGDETTGRGIVMPRFLAKTEVK
ncbi:MAG: type III-B CRISPR module RAMP protein Cmr4 [Anaerolineae bacterium]|nr:type III-B CRISPR module RAMP protein Cmr4 [Anaerolineae bacterium]